MLELVLNLIDQLVNLANHRQKSDKRVFDHFVDPAFKSFEQVHSYYITAFKQYKQMLDIPRKPLGQNHPIFERILMDRLYNQELLSKCWSLERHAEDEVLGKFVHAILSYLSVSLVQVDSVERESGATDPPRSTDSAIGMVPIDETSRNAKSIEYGNLRNRRWVLLGDMRQIPSASFYNGLDRLVDLNTPLKVVRGLANEDADLILTGLQAAYARVADEYSAVKDRLLRPK